MFWVVQENVAREEHHETLVNALQRFELPHAIVKVVPFAATLEPDINPENPVVVIGSVSLANKVVPKKGWKPGAWINENFDFTVWREHWKGNLLNWDAVVSPFNEVRVDSGGPFFIRPCADNKAFTGQEMWPDEYMSWYHRLLDEDGASDLNFDIREPVMIAPLKKIYREMRFFIVDRRVVTASVYRIGGKTVYQEESFIDRDAFTFVTQLVCNIPPERWVPAEAFVMDVALTPDGYKVIEINCINSAGFYKADVAKLVEAIENLAFSSGWKI